MTARIVVDKVYDDNLAQDVPKFDDLGLIPNGETWRIKEFGGSEAANGDGVASAIGLQFTTDDGSSWTDVVKMWIVGSCPMEPINRDFIGDGANVKLRLVRLNKSTANKDVIARISGIRLGSTAP